MKLFCLSRVVAIIMLVLSQFALAQTGQGNSPASTHETRVNATQSMHQVEHINLSLENADVKELIRWASDHIDKNIIVHPQVKGKVTVLAGEPIPPGDAYKVFLSVLQVHGYTVIETDSAIKVVPAKMATQSNVPVMQSERSRYDEDIVVRIAKIRNVAAAQLVNLLRPMMPPEALLTAYPDTNLLILSDRANNIERIMQIIERIDRAGVIDIELLSLNFASAKDVIGVINRLIPTAAAPGGAPQSFTIAEDARSNSILMTGDPIVRKQIRDLIRRLDTPLSGEGNTQVVFINFANAASLVPVLQSISGNVQKADRDQTYANVEVKIEVSEENNALVISAPPALLDTMKGVIRQLDVRRAQVLVEAVIVEVNDDRMNDLGVEWFTNSNNDDPFVSVGALPNTLAAPDPPAFGGGLTLGFFSNNQLRGLVRALEADSDSNVLSTPTIVALDNEEAEILVGSNVPFITGSSTGSASSTDNPFQTIERQDIGITLKVKPRINNDDSITLNVEQTVENIAPATASDIITNKREIKTRVLIENDEVLVLGGLINDEINEVTRRVPLLGHIPLLGRAFRSKSTQVTKKNLMVFIHPRILRTRQQNDVATRQRYERFQDLQRGYNQRREVFLVPKAGPMLPDMDALAPQAINTLERN